MGWAGDLFAGDNNYHVANNWYVKSKAPNGMGWRSFRRRNDCQTANMLRLQ